jgi:hypothetical protein
MVRLYRSLDFKVQKVAGGRGIQEIRTELCLENLKKRDNVRDLGSDERMILKWIIKKQYVRMWTVFSWLMCSNRIYKDGSELSSTVKSGNIFIS